MGVYREQILPRFTDRMLSVEPIMAYRVLTTEGLHGRIVEIGFGSGLNVASYPPEVTHVYAIEPAVIGRKLASERVAASSAKVEYIGLDGESLPLDDESCDAALSTYTLCTIPDVRAAISEIYRVLKPGARFHVLEHGRARDADVARWQDRLTPIQRRVAGGCHLNRDHGDLLRAGGFEIEELDEWYAKGPKTLSAFYRGVAVKPG